MKKVCIQGVGFVGAAMSIAVSRASNDGKNPIYDVIAVDLPNEIGLERVNAINKGEFPFETSDKFLLDSIKKAHRQGNLHATTDPAVYSNADIVLVDVQFDISYLDDKPKIFIDEFRKSIQVIGKYVQPKTLIIVETTVPPGTCEKIVVPTLHNELIKREIEPFSVYVAHSYERVMPGRNYLKSITDNWRVFAGNNKEAGDLCERFLCNIVNVQDYPLTRLSSMLSSETAKVMENTYRATTIAFIDEWTKFAESVGIDLFEIIDAIKMRPTHSNIRYPGLGVGGYCLTKDPKFTPAASKELFDKDLEFPFSSLAVRVNHEMPLHTVSRIKSLLNFSLKDQKILVCGVIYREDVGDTRYSPSEILVRELVNQGAKVSCHDPYLKFWKEMGITMQKEMPLAANFNAIIFAVQHQQYRELDLKSWVNSNTIILDANSVFNSDQRKIVREKGARLESIGRGNGL